MISSTALKQTGTTLPNILTETENNNEFSDAFDVFKNAEMSSTQFFREEPQLKGREPEIDNQLFQNAQQTGTTLPNTLTETENNDEFHDAFESLSIDISHTTVLTQDGANISTFSQLDPVNTTQGTASITNAIPKLTLKVKPDNTENVKKAKDNIFKSFCKKMLKTVYFPVQFVSKVISVGLGAIEAALIGIFAGCMSLVNGLMGPNEPGIMAPFFGLLMPVALVGVAAFVIAAPISLIKHYGGIPGRNRFSNKYEIDISFFPWEKSSF